MLVDVAMALLPFLDITDLTEADLVCHILRSEFGSVVVDCITHDMCSAKKFKSDCQKAHHSALKKSPLQLPVSFSWNVRRHGPPLFLAMSCLTVWLTITRVHSGLYLQHVLFVPGLLKTVWLLTFQMIWHATIWTSSESWIHLSFDIALFRPFRLIFHSKTMQLMV